MEGYQCVGMELSVMGWSVEVEITDINSETGDFDYCVSSINGHGVATTARDAAKMEDINTASFYISLESKIREALIKSRKLEW